MNKTITHLMAACSISLIVTAADNTFQAKLLATVALQHTMKSANFSSDGTKMFGATINDYAVLYELKKEQCVYQRLLNDVRSMRYDDVNDELLICDQHMVSPFTYYMQVIRAHLKTDQEAALYNALKAPHIVFDCSASYNTAKDRALVVEPENIIAIDVHSGKSSVVLRSPCAHIECASYVNDHALVVQAYGNAWVYNIANTRYTTLFQNIGYDQGHEQLKSVTHNGQSILLHTSQRIITHNLQSGKYQVVEPAAGSVDQAILHPTQAGATVLLKNREVVVKNYAGQTMAQIASPLHRYASCICSVYNNLLLLLSQIHQEVTLCDLEKKQSSLLFKSNGDRLLQAKLCADNKVQIATSKKVLTYDISQPTG